MAEIHYKLNVQGVNVPLIAFNTIFDTDFGLLLLIDRKFLDKKVFNVQFFNEHHTIKRMMQALTTRDDINPLSLCLNDSYKEKADELYNEFIDRYYSEILELSMITGIADVVKMAEITNGDVNASIVCMTEDEAALVKKHIGDKTSAYLLSEVEPLLGYSQQFIFKYLHDDYAECIIPHINDKTIYFAKYPFNRLDEKNPDPIALTAVQGYNQLSMIEIYSSEKLFVESI